MSAIDKALSLMDHFTDLTPEIGLSEFQRKTGRDKATLFRHLSALEQRGFLEQDARTRAYRLGPTINRLATMRQSTVDPAHSLAPLIDAISEDMDELVHLSSYSGDVLRPIYHANRSNQTIRVAYDQGWAPPLLQSSSGRAVLAFLPEQTATALLDASDLTAPSRRALQRDLSEIQARGYANTSDTVEVGVSSVAVPVFDARGEASGACGIAYPTVRDGREIRQRAATILARNAPSLTHRLGGTVPPSLTPKWRAIRGADISGSTR